METIKAITFDFGGTLANGDLDKDNYKKALIDYFFRLGFSGGKAKFNKARKAMLQRLRKARKRNENSVLKNFIWVYYLILDYILHKKSWTIQNIKNYFSKSSMTSLKRYVVKTINLDQIDNLAIKNNLKQIELKGYKVLGRGSLSSKISIKADSFSKSAEEKIKKFGAKAELIVGKVKEKAEEKPPEEPEKPKETE